MKYFDVKMSEDNYRKICSICFLDVNSDIHEGMIHNLRGIEYDVYKIALTLHYRKGSYEAIPYEKEDGLGDDFIKIVGFIEEMEEYLEKVRYFEKEKKYIKKEKYLTWEDYNNYHKMHRKVIDFKLYFYSWTPIKIDMKTNISPAKELMLYYYDMIISANFYFGRIKKHEESVKYSKFNDWLYEFYFNLDNFHKSAAKLVSIKVAVEFYNSHYK